MVIDVSLQEMEPLMQQDIANNHMNSEADRSPVEVLALDNAWIAASQRCENQRAA